MDYELNRERGAHSQHPRGGPESVTRGAEERLEDAVAVERRGEVAAQLRRRGRFGHHTGP